MKQIFKSSIVFGLLFTLTNQYGHAQVQIERTENSKDNITIKFLKNIEFLGFVLHIGDPENVPSQAVADHPFRLALNEKKEKFINAESISKIFELGEEFSYSLFVELFAKMDELPKNEGIKLPVDILQNHYLNTSADIFLIQEIMEQVDLFYEFSEFEIFWETHQDWYNIALVEIDEIKPDYEVINNLENFYEQQFSTYKIIPSLTFWSGPGFGFKGENTAYFVLGPFTDDFKFNDADRLKTLAIHEFGHAFANEILETNCSDIIEETRPLFDPIAESMYSQSYPEWSYCVTEHFVRAGEVLIPELMNNKTISQSNLKWNTEERNFIYLPFIVDRLRIYRIAEGLSYEQSVRKTMEDLKERYMP